MARHLHRTEVMQQEMSGHQPTDDITRDETPTDAIPDSLSERGRVLSEVITLCDDVIIPVVVEKATDMSRTPSISDDGAGIIVAEEFNEDAIVRMAWILESAMGVIMPTLPPEQQKLIEGTTDLRQLIGPLFRKWEEFRSIEGRAKKNRKIAQVMYERVKRNFTNNEMFEGFWKRKVAEEKDAESYKKFEGVVRGVLGQVDTIDRVLSGMNNVCPRVLLMQMFTPASALFAVVVLFLRVLATDL
jgi:hypothetical protein